MKKILIACLEDPQRNPRPNRILKFCNESGFTVDLLSYPTQKRFTINNHYLIPEPRIPQARLPRFLRKVLIVIGLVIGRISGSERLKKYLHMKRYNTEIIEELDKDHSYDLIIIEDLQLLPQLVPKKGNAHILFDAREYYPRQKDESLAFRLFDKPNIIRICNNYLPLCDTTITVSQGLADEYENEFGISPHVVRSLPYYTDMKAKRVNSKEIKMVHHGIANRNRKLENLIAVMDRLDSRFSLDLYLTHHHDYISELKQLSQGNSRIQFKKPVPFDEIIPMLNQYDVGFYYLEPSSFNLKHSLPNKFFEFIQARLMVAIGPSPEMSRLIRKYKCGVVSSKFSISSMANALDKLDADKINKAKMNSDKAARELCYERESKKIDNIINELL